ncbi:MAG TPA: SpoIIE family protein phosphatase [Kiritimatiellia bacterium]|nr:SpoIIE family protein phosphatase [Kiritimatiellia bacterium]HMP34835.1 SpoIIE family protein phosphatase [Kiritimatiellia bacterium]
MNHHVGMTTEDGTLRPRVLLVDDDAFSRRLMRPHLDPDYDITECADADAAFSTLQTTPCDAALVDVEMPGRDGYALCRQLREHPATANMPVILVTAKSDITDLERGFEAGATDYIRKPFNPRELMVRVRNAVELKRRGDSIRRWRERIDRDLAMAGALQRSMLAPRPMVRSDLRIYTSYQSSIEVGGDLFDMMTLPDGRIALYVGDVAGHGVGAAVAATYLKATLSEVMRHHEGARPSHIANQLHRLFITQLRSPGLYATLFLALIDPRTRHWQCINCGHPAPIVIAPPSLKQRDFEDRGGPPVGFPLTGDQPFHEEDEVSLDLPEEVSILLVTDGLLEAENRLDPERSTRGELAMLISEWLKHRTSDPMESIVRGFTYAGFALGQDDYTMMLVEQIPSAQIVFSGTTALDPARLAALATAMEQRLAEHGWPASSTWAAHLILVEHGANVLAHGRSAIAPELSVQVRCMDQALELMIIDNGNPWRYEEAPVLPEDHAADHGRGLMMIRRAASFVVSHRRDDRNLSLFGVQKEWSMPS